MTPMQEILKERAIKVLSEKMKIVINLIELHTVLKTLRERNLTEIMTEMRAIKGVTIVSIIEPTKNVGKEYQLTKIKIKVEPQTPNKQEFLNQLVKEVQNIKGVVSMRIYNNIDISVNTARGRKEYDYP